MTNFLPGHHRHGVCTSVINGNNNGGCGPCFFSKLKKDYLGSDVFGKPTIIYLLLANCHIIAT